MTSRFVSQILYPLAGVVLIVAVWALACWLVDIPTVVLPSPDRVLRALIIRGDLLLSEGWITLKETLYGFLLALAVGLPLAVAVANSRPLNLMFYPLLIALQSVPKVALAPMILVWLGTGLESKLAIVWLVAFFPIIVDTAAGLRATPKELLELANSLNASPLQVFIKVQPPPPARPALRHTQPRPAALPISICRRGRCRSWSRAPRSRLRSRSSAR